MAKKMNPKSATPVSSPAPQPQAPDLAGVTAEQLAAFNLNDHTWRLMQEEPFFAAVMRHVNKISSEAVPTAGVTVDPKTAQFVMYYNPRFFCCLTDIQKRGVLTHELYHLVLEHCTTRKPEDKKLAKLWNYATDLAINSFLDGKLPDFCLFPGRGIFANYPPLMTAEWYFHKLLNDPNVQKAMGNGEGNGEGGQGNGQFDDHEGWGDQQVNGEAQAATEVAKERLRDIMKKATEEVLRKGNNWGTVSADMQKDILSRIQNTVDWKKVLRCFVRTSKRSDKVGTVRKINKRYPYIHPGKKVTRHANIAVSIDQSGSVGDELLATFFAELNALSDIASFTVIPFDSRVIDDKVFVWKKGQHRRWERVACGGTDFDAPTSFVNERNFDGHIILTDMCAPKPRPSKCQRLWCTDEQNAKQPYFQCTERVIAVRVKTSV